MHAALQKCFQALEEELRGLGKILKQCSPSRNVVNREIFLESGSRVTALRKARTNWTWSDRLSFHGFVFERWRDTVYAVP